jgi:subtilisin family serine protease
MSWGVDCDSVSCRQADRADTPFNDLAGSANRPVFVAAAGNGQGGNGYNVGDPRFFHPCIEDHVICVGALNTGAANATDRIQYSNFGDRVDVFAPTNIPVMSYPNGAGAVGPRTFGGTSAATPYVAGIAAMMKALDPSLGSDQIAALLRETAIPGTGDAKRVVDALAAVRRVAQPFPMVKDRHEPNSLDNAPRDLGSAAAYVENNLNLDPSDRDFFRFRVPGGSMATITLRYASRLGTVTVARLVGRWWCLRRTSLRQ